MSVDLDRVARVLGVAGDGGIIAEVAPVLPVLDGAIGEVSRVRRVVAEAVPEAGVCLDVALSDLVDAGDLLRKVVVAAEDHERGQS